MRFTAALVMVRSEISQCTDGSASTAVITAVASCTIDVYSAWVTETKTNAIIFHYALAMRINRTASFTVCSESRHARLCSGGGNFVLYAPLMGATRCSLAMKTYPPGFDYNCG